MTKNTHGKQTVAFFNRFVNTSTRFFLFKRGLGIAIYPFDSQSETLGDTKFSNF